MSISPAQFAIVMAAAQPLDKGLAGGPSSDAQPSAGSAPSATAEPSEPTLSTDLRIDDQRRIYYEIINNRSGDVVMEIPPEEIRKLAEALAASPAVVKPHSVDVKT